MAKMCQIELTKSEVQMVIYELMIRYETYKYLFWTVLILLVGTTILFCATQVKLAELQVKDTVCQEALHEDTIYFQSYCLGK